MVKKAVYSPLGDTLSVETAFIQAALALDVAAQFAVECKDVEGLSGVASLYIELGSRLLRMGDEGEEDDEEVDQDALDRKVALGFRPEVIEPHIDEETIVDE